ncbi:MAG: hypothetical protein ACTTHG_07355 [Treponemataceae bacterium]
MKKDKPFVFFLLASLCIFFLSCSDGVTNSKLSINYKEKSYPLIACNSEAKSASILNPEKEPYMIFKFPKELFNELKSLDSKTAQNSSPALELTIKIKDFCTDNNFFENTNFAIYFLTEKEFFDYQKVKDKQRHHESVSGKLTRQNTFENRLTISYQIPKTKKTEDAVAGFVIYSTQKILILNSKITQTKLGWKFCSPNPWFGYVSKGGILVQNIEQAQNAPWNFSYENDSSFSDNSIHAKNFPIYVELSNILKQNSKRKNNELNVKMKIANAELNLYPWQNEHKITLNSIMFENNNIENVYFVKNNQFVNSLVFDLSAEIENSKPILADPGLIIHWPKENWRSKDFELFAWEEFPSILILDFADYSVQDKFLKRLAFFVEKANFVGTLLKDEQMISLHGYNAHDYKSEDLAGFFTAVEKQNFQLNNEELMLKQILLDNGWIKYENGIFSGTNTALISISKESPDYLRTTFICHEGMHGIFFIDSEFRTFIYELFDKTDKNSIEFIKAYFFVTPSLSYDIKNDYLLRNEFMAYLFQQPLSAISQYFGTNLANRHYINKFYPEIAKICRETQAQGFVEAAEKLDEYAQSRWAFNLGRNWKITCTFY